MAKLNIPKTYDFGAGELVELEHLEKTFEVSRGVALKYLKVLHIKPLYIRDQIFFSLPTFNRIMFVLSRPGSPGFLFPSSRGRANRYLRSKGYLVEVTDEILREAKSPRILAEMSAASGRNDAMVKKLLTTGKDEKGENK